MPLTNAQKQAAHRARRDAKLARYEAALRWIDQNTTDEAAGNRAGDALEDA